MQIPQMAKIVFMAILMRIALPARQAVTA